MLYWHRYVWLVHLSHWSLGGPSFIYTAVATVRSFAFDDLDELQMITPSGPGAGIPRSSAQPADEGSPVSPLIC